MVFVRSIYDFKEGGNTMSYLLKTPTVVITLAESWKKKYIERKIFLPVSILPFFIASIWPITALMGARIEMITEA